MGPFPQAAGAGFDFSSLLGPAGMGLGILGTGLSAYGTYESGMQQRQAYEAQEGMLRQRAEAVESAMGTETTKAHEQARKLKASQVAAYAKSGAEISSGTPLLVLAEQAGEMERDILEQRRNRMIQAQGLRHQADVAKYQGRMASRAGILGAGGTLLGGAAGLGGLF
jgi:hypothetical protein